MRVILACILALGFAQPASASQVRNFFAPQVEGARIDACLTDGTCGKPAADAFCKVQGYDRATIFQREDYSATRSIDSGKLCSGVCIAFKQVKCISAKSDRASLQTVL